MFRANRDQFLLGDRHPEELAWNSPPAMTPSGYPVGVPTPAFPPPFVEQLDVSVRQPLLRGAGIAVNRAPIQVSQAKWEQSGWEFKKALLASLRSVIAAYWDLFATKESRRKQGKQPAQESPAGTEEETLERIVG